MRALSLDYRQAKVSTQHWLGVAVLALALAGAVKLGLYYRHISAQTEHLEDLSAMIEHKLHKNNTPVKLLPADVEQSNSEIKMANDVMQKLALPWPALFSSLEEANSDDVALLGVEPDTKKGMVKVSGEAKNFETLFAYLRKVQASKSMTNVYLQHHQIQDTDPEKPIRFTLEASWLGKQ